MSAGLRDTSAPHHFIIFTTFTHNRKIAARQFFLWEFVQGQLSYNRRPFEELEMKHERWVLFSALIHLNQKSFNQKKRGGREM